MVTKIIITGTSTSIPCRRAHNSQYKQYYHNATGNARGVRGFFALFPAVRPEFPSNPAAAAIAVPVVQSIAQALGLNPIPYLFVAIVAFNSAYVLPVSIRAIPVSYGLDPAELFKNGLLLSLCSVLLITVVGYLFIRYWPLFSTV